MSDKRKSQDKPLVILSSSADYPRWKSYAISEFGQQRCEWTMMAKRERPTLDSIHEKLMKKGFTEAQLIPQILINTMIWDKEKYALAMSKAAGILSKIISNQHQLIIKGKTLEEAWSTFQQRFQHIKPNEHVTPNLQCHYKETGRFQGHTQIYQ